MKKYIKIILKLIVKVWIFSIETPYYLFVNRNMLRCDKIILVYENSFGHAFAYVDFAARLFYPNNLTVLWLNHSKTNKFIPFCFSNLHTIYVYDFRILINVNEFRVSIINFYLSLLRNFFSFDILTKKTIYQTLSLAHNNLLIGRDNLGISETLFDWTGYEFLLKNNIGSTPIFPKIIESEIIRAVTNFCPDFFSKKTVCFLLRSKGFGDNFDNYIRSCGPQENYIDAIKFLVSKNFNVIGFGETSPEIFKNIPGFFHASEIPYDYQALNLFFLMKSNYFIGQQSGPLLIPNSCGIPCLILDAMPHCLGTFSNLDFILFKNLYLKKVNKKISIPEVYNTYPDLALGYNFSFHDINVHPNSKEEILNAVKYFVQINEDEIDSTLESKFLLYDSNQVAKSYMRIYYQKNTILESI